MYNSSVILSDSTPVNWWVWRPNLSYIANQIFLVLWGWSSTESHEKHFQETVRKLSRKQEAKAEVSNSEESISTGTSSPRAAGETEEEKSQDIESSTPEDVVVSQREPSVLSDEIDESREGSIQRLEEMQVEGDSSLKPPLNQENVMVQEEEEEKEEMEKEGVKGEKEEEEEEENEEEEVEEKEEQESLSMDEVGQQWIHSWVWEKCAMFTLCIHNISWGPQWCSLHWSAYEALQMYLHLLFLSTRIQLLSHSNAF